MTTTPKGRRAVTRVKNTSPNIEAPTLVEFILDETGSMSCCKDSVIAGFNDFIEEQKSIPGSCQITLTKFEGGNYHTPYQDLELSMVPQMSDKMFNPGGMTNLFDAIGTRVVAIQDRIKNWTIKPNVLFVVMTDGEDNMSRSFNQISVKSLMEANQELGWTCVYLGAQDRALEIAKRLGFKDGNIKSFHSAQMKETMRDLSAATTVYRTSSTKTASFF